ncbi:MAG: hypothetical protein UF412_06510 [Anaerostipes hadrus]|nr:hypothetical protein [Anaerostipes hadrus]
MLGAKNSNENSEILSAKKYNEIIKAKKNKKYLNMLDQSMNEAKEGRFITIRSIEELEK